MSRLRRALVGRLAGEGGFTLVEAIVALTILAFAGAGFAVSTNGGLRMVGVSQERQTAVQVANEWMEQARVIPFSGLALPDPTTWEGVGTPDEDVSVDGTQYTSDAGTETLVLAAGSTFTHVVTETVNGVEYVAYRYVTWVPHGAVAQAYKRVTIVVQWLGTPGEPVSVTIGSIIAGDGIVWSSTTTAPPGPTSTTSTTMTTPTVTAPSLCVGDLSAPTGSVSILAGSGAQNGYTKSSTVTLSLSASDSCTPIYMSFSNDGTSFSEPVEFDQSAVWTLASGNGTRTMYTRLTDGIGNSATVASSVVVDGEAPTQPGSFTATVVSSPTRVVLTWSGSTDNEGVLGYRVYVATGAGSFQNQPTGVSHPCPTSPCTWTHTGVKNRDTYTYYVVSYDAAGNESPETPQLTRTI